MIDIVRLRSRIAELERFEMKNAPAPVRERSQFDLKALQMLLSLIEGEKGNAGKI